MKKIIALLILGLSFAACISAQKADTTGYKIKNALIGFGLGSRQQDDINSADFLLKMDLTGLTLMAAGGTGLGLTSFIYQYLHAYYGDVTTADFWISGSVLGLGAVVFISGRILGIILPDRFVINENANLSMDVLEDGDVALSLQLRL